MESANVAIPVIYELSDSTIFRISNGNRQVVSTGKLQVLQMSKTELFLFKSKRIILKSNNFQYMLDDKQKFSKSIYYVLPGPNNSFFGIELSSQYDPKIFSDLEQIFLEVRSIQYCSLEGIVLEQTTATQIQGGLMKGGDMIKDGILKGAGFLSKGISKGGEVVIKNTDKGKEVKVSNQIKIGVFMAKTTTGVEASTSQESVQKMILVAKSVGGEYEQKIKDNQNVKKIQETQSFGEAKKVLKGTGYAISSIYDGMFNAMVQVGQQTATTTGDIVTHQYGSELGNTTQNGIDTLVNFAAISQGTQNGMMKIINQECSKPEGEVVKKKGFF